MALKHDIPEGFERPTELPHTSIQHDRWQAKNRSWWEAHPMRYDWKESVGHPEFSREFYQEIDRRFFTEAKKFMPWTKTPFESLIPFEGLAEQDVLEIGVGNGSHAQLLASHAKSFTGIDLTDYAVKSTSARMKCFGLRATIVRMDAEQMQFDDGSFDFIWSWGVIHHSANTEQILREMHRVLRPGGTAVTMVYHRNPWNFYVMSGLFHGLIRGEWFKTRSLHRIVQIHTDGAIARFYTIAEWRSLVAKFFDVTIQIFGSKPELFPLPAGKFKNRMMALAPDRLTRLMLNQLRCGSFLVSTLKKK